ncbi:MAG: ComF family protein [Chloroflexi bacterium]|nr:ComF family protein [Chloroflexota bacterium]
MKDLARAVAVASATALVPPLCAGCDRPGSWFCLECRHALEPRSFRSCGLSFHAAGAYEGPLRLAIQRCKYRDERGLTQELGELVAGMVAGDLALGARIDAVVPVPLHRERVRARGYDQAALLGAQVSGRTGLPVLPALHRIRHTRPQVELDRAERASNVDGAFVSEAGSLRGLRVAIVDDVTTTGATCHAAAIAARAGGARDVRAYVIAVDE